MRLGILGGTFDPIHIGHLLLAETAWQDCPLDAVWFLPTGQPPHKRDRTLTPPRQRVEMLKLAIAGHPAFDVSTMETDRRDTSYTFETLETIRQQRPEDELFFLMGADSLRDLPHWRNPERVCELAVPVIARRRGAPVPDCRVLEHLVSPERLEVIRQSQIEMPVVEFSSTAIRDSIAAGRSVRYQVPRAVEMYIQTRGLYRGAS